MNHFALDLARLLHVLFKKVTLSKGSFKDLMAVIEPNEEAPAVAVALTLFTSYVAQERGTTQRHLHGLIKESLWPRMDEDERYLFFSSVADKFLARPSG